MIRNCRIWVLGVLVVTLAAGTTVMMAASAKSRGDADSVLSVLLASPAQADKGERVAASRESGGLLVSSKEVARLRQKHQSDSRRTAR